MGIFRVGIHQRGVWLVGIFRVRVFLVLFTSFKICSSTKTQTIMNDTEEIILLTLILRSRRWKKEIIVQHVQSLNFGCEIFLPEENSMMNFIVWRKSWSLVSVVKTRVFMYLLTKNFFFFLRQHFYFIYFKK